MQQFQQSSATSKVIIILGLLGAIAGVLVCGCAAAGWFFLFSSRSDVAPPVIVSSPLPPLPSAKPTPVEFQGWRGEYFNNTNLLSEPALVRNEPEINYNWGATSPIPGTIPDNNYAVRWSRGAEFDMGNYLFRAEVAGGVRVYLDGQLLIDSWSESDLRQVEGTANLKGGQHGLKVEYWKQNGSGQIYFSWAKLQEPNQPPLPVIDAPSQAGVGDIVTFDSSRSTSANPIVRYTWEFGDGTRVDNAVKAQNAYTKVGTYRVKLTVEDNQGLQAMAYHQIEIRDVQPEPTPEPDQPPAARISAPVSIKVGESFIVDAADSRCATTCVSYTWDMGDGQQAKAITFQHVYQSPGDFNVVLTVTDDKGLQGTVNQLIKVTVEALPEQPQPPTAVINGPTLAAVSQALSFSSGSQPGSGGPIVEYVWDFGDGSQDNSGPAVTHTYTNTGSFTVRLTVADGQGQSDTAEWPIQISAAVEPPPTPTEEPGPRQLPSGSL